MEEKEDVLRRPSSTSLQHRRRMAKSNIRRLRLPPPLPPPTALTSLQIKILLRRRRQHPPPQTTAAFSSAASVSPRRETWGLEQVSWQQTISSSCHTAAARLSFCVVRAAMAIFVPWARCISISWVHERRTSGAR